MCLMYVVSLAVVNRYSIDFMRDLLGARPLPAFALSRDEHAWYSS